MELVRGVVSKPKRDKNYAENEINGGDMIVEDTIQNELSKFII